MSVQHFFHNQLHMNTDDKNAAMKNAAFFGKYELFKNNF